MHHNCWWLWLSRLSSSGLLSWSWSWSWLASRCWSGLLNYRNDLIPPALLCFSHQREAWVMWWSNRR
jgi:hypothetical protein